MKFINTIYRNLYLDSVIRMDKKRNMFIGAVAVAALMLTAVLVMAPQGAEASTEFDGGAGTWEDPYVISTVEQLQAMNENLSAHYVLGTFIDASDTAGWNDGAGFKPIGNDSEPFTGSLRGSAEDDVGFLIVGLFINSDEDDVGLFGYTHEDAVIERVGLANAEVNGKNNTGALVGWNLGTISKCFVTGNVSGEGNVGGLVGKNSGNISDSYSLVDILEGDTVGGLVGEIATGGEVNRTYAAGNVTDGEITTGGLVGTAVADSVQASFWDTNATGQDASPQGEGKTTAEMMNKSTFEDAGWDFDEVWRISEGQSYPRLQALLTLEDFEEWLSDLLEDLDEILADLCASVVLIPLIAGGLVVAARRK